MSADSLMLPNLAQGHDKIGRKSHDFRVLLIDAAAASPYHPAAWKISVIDHVGA